MKYIYLYILYMDINMHECDGIMIGKYDLNKEKGIEKCRNISVFTWTKFVTEGFLIIIITNNDVNRQSNYCISP